ncbi:hypothetical protein N9Y92_01860 [Chlamydiales bacterium]|nr:hypothetical protein [Chlamydiales bacterium]
MVISPIGGRPPENVGLTPGVEGPATTTTTEGSAAAVKEGALDKLGGPASKADVPPPSIEVKAGSIPTPLSSLKVSLGKADMTKNEFEVKLRENLSPDEANHVMDKIRDNPDLDTASPGKFFNTTKQLMKSYTPPPPAESASISQPKRVIIAQEKELYVLELKEGDNIKDAVNKFVVEMESPLEVLNVLKKSLEGLKKEEKEIENSPKPLDLAHTNRLAENRQNQAEKKAAITDAIKGLKQAEKSIQNAMIRLKEQKLDSAQTEKLNQVFSMNQEALRKNPILE